MKSLQEPSAADARIDILIVDDREENLAALQAVLEDLKQNVVAVRSGAEALKRTFNQDFAVILMDVRMPDMDGFEAAEFIRNRPRSKYTPIIFLTAFDATQDRMARAYALGAVDYIPKPINSDVLKAKVRVFVELFRKTRSLEREVQERKRAEENLRAANDELEAFTYSVSHDLRGPLRSMSGFSQALLEDLGGAVAGTPAEDMLKRIMFSARRMDTLILDLLSFSRLSREEVRLGDIDPGEIVREVVAQSTDAGATYSIAPEFPRVHGNERLLGQVFTNLISNAVKFVRPGAEAEVSIHSESSGNRVRIWVEDNGIGIPSEHHGRVFKVFERLHTQEEYPGTGIGLAIVRRAMERMDGRTGLESVPDQGSKFWIELRRGNPGSGSAPQSSASVEKPHA